MSGRAEVEELLRQLAPQVTGALVRRHGQFDLCEDAVQEALVAAAVQWPRDGIPEHPRGWLMTVASRRLTDQVRGESARRRREQAVAASAPADELVAPGPDAGLPAAHDDTLALLFLCCHPALSPASQVALTLRAVGGLTTAQVARAFLVPEATMAQRISRAKQTIKAAGAHFTLPPPAERADRLRVVLQVLYLIFNEGYAASSGPDLQRADLTGEAIRLARQLHRLLPDDGEVAGLLALLLLTDARRPARAGSDGSLIPLASQDRSRWDAAAIAEGAALVADALARAPLGPYQLQAAIAAVHDEAARAEATDWPQILVLYELLQRLAPSPVVTLNQAVALAMVRGRGPASSCWPPSTTTPAWRGTTVSTRSGPTCWSWPATPPPPATTTGRPPAAPPASPSSATLKAGRPAWTRDAEQRRNGMRFHTTILRGGKTATGIQVPDEVVAALGSGRRPPVKVTINGYTYRSTVAVMGGAYMVGVSAEHRAGAGGDEGDEVDVDLELDTAPREVEVPADLAAALDAEPAARSTFDGLSYSNRSWHVLQVTGAKTEETRQRRIARSVDLLKQGRAR